jgi:hypothetical protein
MGEYKDNLDFEPHNFNTTTVTLKALESGDIHVLQALHTLEVSRKESRWTTQEVNSGVSIDVEKPSTAGSAKWTLLDASPSTDWLFDHIDERVQVTVADSNAPNLNCSGKGRLMVPPPIKRADTVDTPEWEVVVKYLKIRGGGYRLVTEE